MQTYKYDSTPFEGKGKEPASNHAASSSKPTYVPPKSTMTRPRVSDNTFEHPQNILISQTTGNLVTSDTRIRRPYRTSNTWASSSADINLISKDEEVNDRGYFVDEYNRLARKYGIRLIILGDFPPYASIATQSLPNRKSSWVDRMLHQGAKSKIGKIRTDKTDQPLRHRRSISDIALNFVHSQRNEGLKTKDLRGLIRLCGKSMFYLPADYTPGTLVLPTCLRATAQYLVQNANTSGIFRVSGSMRVINNLYEYYCADVKGEDVSTTTRCPNLPSHLICGVHDVASTFKRILGGLPGGILGSLTLFDALVAIHSQLHSYAETTRTKETKLRARLIALAISTVESKHQRELICAVFGLLCLVGRAAEMAPREDESGRPLPTSDLMGYNALSIIFGPLLVGDLLRSYSMKLADPAMGLIILPLTPCKSGKHRRVTKAKPQKPTMLTIDRVLVANDIAEMLLVHWRDVVRHLKSLGANRKQEAGGHVWTGPDHSRQEKHETEQRLSVPATTYVQGSPDGNTVGLGDHLKKKMSSLAIESPNPSARLDVSKPAVTGSYHDNLVSVKRHRPRPSSDMSLHRISRGHSMGALSPTIEESPSGKLSHDRRPTLQNIKSTPASFKSGKKDQLPLSEFGSHIMQETFPGMHDSQARTSRNEEYTINLDSESNHGKCLSTTCNDVEGMRCESSSSQGTTRRNPPSDAVSDTDYKGEKRRPLLETSTASYTPCLDHDDFSGTTPTIYHLALSETDARLSSNLSRCRTQTPATRESIAVTSTNLDENMPCDATPAQRVLSQSATSPDLCMEKIPNYRPSALDPLRTPPEYAPEYAHVRQLPVTFRGTASPNHLPSIELCNSPSLKCSVADDCIQPPLAVGDLAPEVGQGQFSIPTRTQSAATLWRELVKNSPLSSLNDIKGKRLARGSLQSSATRTEVSSHAVTGVPTPEWKRQLMKSKSENETQLSSLSPERKSLVEISPGSGVPGVSSIATKRSPTRSHTGPQPSSYSQRSTSKPVSGTVRSIAARFENVSQESTPNQFHSERGKSQTNLRGSRSFLSQDTKIESPIMIAKNPLGSEVLVPETSYTKTAEDTTKESPAKKVVTPNRFRASISRLSHSLRPGSTRYKKDESPSGLGIMTMQPSQRFIAARNEPLATPTRVPRRDLGLTRPLSGGTISPPREEPPVARHLIRSHHASGASIYEPMTPQARDDIAAHEQYSSRAESGASSTLHRQVRSLRKQVEYRNDEIQGLRRQLDASYITDSGTLSEQLRQAKRECKMWRERAEAAEKRVAIFEKLTTRLGTLREGNDGVKNIGGWEVDEEMHSRNELGSSSSFSDHSQNQEMYKNRIRRSFIKTNARIGGGDGTDCPEMGVGDASAYPETDQRTENSRNTSMDGSPSLELSSAEEDVSNHGE